MLVGSRLLQRCTSGPSLTEATIHIAVAIATVQETSACHESPVRKEFEDIPGVVVQALKLEGVIGLLFGQKLNEAQERGAQAAASVGCEGHECETLVGVDLVFNN